MVWFSRDELRKLAAICDDRRTMCELVRDNEVDGANYDHLERCIANREAEYMAHLVEKLLKVADSSAKRVEIVF